eukprot:5579-Heterococcus_DN1.PRE.4
MHVLVILQARLSQHLKALCCLHKLLCIVRDDNCRVRVVLFAVCVLPQHTAVLFSRNGLLEAVHTSSTDTSLYRMKPTISDYKALQSVQLQSIGEHMSPTTTAALREHSDTLLAAAHPHKSSACAVQQLLLALLPPDNATAVCECLQCDSSICTLQQLLLHAVCALAAENSSHNLHDCAAGCLKLRPILSR